MCERNVYRMHALRREDVDGPGKRSRGGRNKDSETAVLKLFNNERRHERLFDFGEGRLPHVFLAASRDLLGQTPKERITWDSFEKRFLYPLSCRSPFRCANRNSDEETDKHYEE